MQRKQTGYVYKRAGWWVLRYRQTVNQAGTLKVVQRAARLVPAGAPHYRTKASVRDLAEEHLAQINKQNQEPQTVVTISDFVTRIFLTKVAEQNRPSSVKNAHDMWRIHLQNRVGGTLLRWVRCADVQRWLEIIAAQDKTKNQEPLRRATLQRIKSFLSSVFKHAKQQGFYDSVNPATDTQVPRAPSSAVTHAYSQREISRMLALITDHTARTIVVVAAYAGLRRGEIEGLRWEDWHDGALWVARSKWGNCLLEPKTQASAAPVPVISSLVEALTNYRISVGNPASGPVFCGARCNKPISMANVANRAIKPTLKAAGLPWYGWHAFRRGLATNLNALGISDLTIQRILRHNDVSTTRKAYIKTLPAVSVAAMEQLESALCAERALEVNLERTREIVN